MTIWAIFPDIPDFWIAGWNLVESEKSGYPQSFKDLSACASQDRLYKGLEKAYLDIKTGSSLTKYFELKHLSSPEPVLSCQIIPLRLNLGGGD